MPDGRWTENADNARAKDVRLLYVRDISVFASFTTLSFVGVKGLISSDIVKVSDEKQISSKRYKTKMPLQVKLLDIPLQIIEHYRPCQESNLTPLSLNYWPIYEPLKKGMKECG